MPDLVCVQGRYDMTMFGYQLHAGWFINCNPGEFISRGLLLNLKVFPVEILAPNKEH